MRNRVYRICELPVWDETRVRAQLPLSELDRRDGYVHLSTARQVPGTLRRFFSGRGDLVLLTIDSDRLVEGSLIFETPTHARPGLSLESAGTADHIQQAYELGLLFPHFYGRVPLEAIVSADHLALDEHGEHVLLPTLREAISAERDDLGTIDVRAVWDPQAEIVFIEYPRPSKIDDEASVYAWEAALERRIDPLVERHGAKLPAVIGLDNLFVATKLEHRYAELAHKVMARWFGVVARWTTRESTREFFARVNEARALPSQIYSSRERALAFVNETRRGLRNSA